MRWSRRGLLAGAVLLTSTGALVAACGAFDEASAPDGTDAATADAASPDVQNAQPPDAASACAKPLVTFSEPFMDSLGAAWAPTISDGGALWVGESPQPGPGPSGNVLRATVRMSDGGSARAHARTTFEVEPLASIDLSYVLLPAAKPVYAQVGCVLALRDRTAKQYTANRFILARHTGAGLYFELNQIVDDVPFATAPDQNTGLSVTGPAHWYAVKLHVDVKPNDRADATLVLTDLVSNETKDASFLDLALVPNVDQVSLECGIYFANGGSGEYEAAVDEVSLTACPR